MMTEHMAMMQKTTDLSHDIVGARPRDYDLVGIAPIVLERGSADAGGSQPRWSAVLGASARCAVLGPPEQGSKTNEIAGDNDLECMPAIVSTRTEH